MHVWFQHTILLKPLQGAWEILHFSVSLMNRINTTEYGIFAPCMISLLLKDLLFFRIYNKKGLRVLFIVLESCKHDIMELPNHCCKPGWTAKHCHYFPKPIATGCVKCDKGHVEVYSLFWVFLLETPSCVKWIWYLSPMRAATVEASLRIRAVSPEPALSRQNLRC